MSASLPRCMELKQLLSNMKKKDTQSMESYLREIKNLVDALAAINSPVSDKELNQSIWLAWDRIIALLSILSRCLLIISLLILCTLVYWKKSNKCFMSVSSNRGPVINHLRWLPHLVLHRQHRLSVAEGAADVAVTAVDTRSGTVPSSRLDSSSWCFAAGGGLASIRRTTCPACSWFWSATGSDSGGALS
ncbi:unnamed protein product [Cuscuta europaea]|uniref:Uncharacterized protein n=1 Tax=Cuscuta europaea TaxID=41803 RepID=A0A9P0YGL1_CUSEU|nr:unnamed protein product [Cuscuta europaea]